MQVASVLRSCGTHVRLVVARPVDPADPGSIQVLSNSTIQLYLKIY